MVELRRRLVILPSPGLASIQAYGCTAIVTGNHALRIPRIDPQPVIVAMRNLDLVEGTSAVGGLEELHIQDVNRVGILRIGDHMHVVPGPLIQAVTAIHQVPAVSAIVGAIEARIFILRFNDRVYAIGIRRHRQPNASVRSLGQTMLRQSLPGRPTIGRAVQPVAAAR